MEVKKETTILSCRWTPNCKHVIYVIIHNNKNPKPETYRYVRVVIFPSSLGIFPDNRLTRTELHGNLAR